MKDHQIRELIEKYNISLYGSIVYEFVEKRGANCVFRPTAMSQPFTKIKINTTVSVDEIAMLKNFKVEIISILRKDLPVFLPYNQG